MDVPKRPYRVGAEQRKDVIAERSLGPLTPRWWICRRWEILAPKKHQVEHGFKLFSAQLLKHFKFMIQEHNHPSFERKLLSFEGW